MIKIYKSIALLILGLVWTLGFFIGASFINILILNNPETIDIASGLVACKDKGGFAYMPFSENSSRCKDGSIVKHLESKEVIKYYEYISKNKYFGINFTDYTNFNYEEMEKN